MFEVNNGITKINGIKGRYDQDKDKSSFNYGRNAVDNYYGYMENPIIQDSQNLPPILDFGLNPNAQDNNLQKIDKYVKENDEYLKALPPLEFEYRYMPQVNNKTGEIDKQALYGAAYEELGQVKEVEVKELDKNFVPNNDYSTQVLDRNNDGKIDVGEYSASILAADMLSKKGEPKLENIDGIINSKGLNAVLAYTKKSNAEAATKMYSNLYNKYNLNTLG